MLLMKDVAQNSPVPVIVVPFQSQVTPLAPLIAATIPLGGHKTLGGVVTGWLERPRRRATLRGAGPVVQRTQGAAAASLMVGDEHIRRRDCGARYCHS